MTGHASARSRRAGKSASLLRRIRSPCSIQRYQHVRAATVAPFGAWNSCFQALRRSLRRYLHRGSPGFGSYRSPLQPGEAPFPAPAGQSKTELVVGLHRAKQVNCCSRIHATAPPRRPWPTGQQEPGVTFVTFMPFDTGCDILFARQATRKVNRPRRKTDGRQGTCTMQAEEKGRGTHRQQAHSNRRGTLATP